MTAVKELAELSLQTWDVLIVGAGIAGSVSALESARRGLKVLFVDQAQFPRNKVCGSCLNGQALAVLERLGLDDLPAQLGAVPIDRVSLMAGKRTADVPIPAGMSVSRYALDAALIDRAVAAGARFHSGVRATMNAADADFRSVVLKSSGVTTTVRSRIVILANGLQGTLVSPQARIGAGTILDSCPAHIPAGRLVMAGAKHGYVGLVRLEAHQLDVAAAFDPAFVKQCGGLGAAAVAVLEDAGVPQIDGLLEADWKGTPALTRKPQGIVGERWFAVGDAAGYVEPFTGEGMAWAMSGAVALAAIAERAALKWEPVFLREWPTVYAHAVGNRQKTCRRLSRVLRHPLLCRCLVRLLAVWPSFARPFTRHLNRPPTATNHAIGVAV